MSNTVLPAFGEGVGVQMLPYQWHHILDTYWHITVTEDGDFIVRMVFHDGFAAEVRMRVTPHGIKLVTETQYITRLAPTAASNAEAAWQKWLGTSQLSTDLHGFEKSLKQLFCAAFEDGFEQGARFSKEVVAER